MEKRLDPVQELYAPLITVLQWALSRAAEGKGKERHAGGLPFIEQPIMAIQRDVGTGFTIGQAMKKLREYRGLSHEDGVAERLDAIIYIAASVVHDEVTKARLAKQKAAATPPPPTSPPDIPDPAPGAVIVFPSVPEGEAPETPKE